MLGDKMNDLLIKALITVMIIDAGMHFYYDYKKNTYQSLKFLILTVLMAVSVGAALTKQETDNVQQRMKNDRTKNRNARRRKGARRGWNNS